MTTPSLQQAKQALVGAGVELYRSKDKELHVAERIRLHIMDSGIRVVLDEGITVRFTARSQQSDFPHAPADELFDKVREVVGAEARTRGYEEVDANTVDVKDPVDDDKVLDVWHEVTFGKTVDALDDAVDEVRWALGLEKYITS